jgi:hypothetical protein
MYCPNCATKAAADQRFCRSCGLNLEAHAEMLTAQLAAGGFDTASLEGIERRERRRKKLQRYGFFTTAAGLLYLFAVGALGLTQKLAGQVDPADELSQYWLVALGLPVLFAGVCLLGYWAYLSLPKASASQPTRLPQPPATMRLPSERSPEKISSVTEHTTELLETSTRDTSRRKE